MATTVYRPELSNLQRWLLFATAVFPASLYVGAQTIANAVLIGVGLPNVWENRAIVDFAADQVSINVIIGVVGAVV